MQREQLARGGGGSSRDDDEGVVVMLRRSSAAARVTCGLCRGLVRDATTVPECLHSFCRSCIYEKFADEEDSCCPTCNIDLGCSPLDKIRADHNLQSVREKLFPSKRQKNEGVPSLHPASVFMLPLEVHGGNHPAKNAPAYLSGEPMNIDQQGKNKDLQTSRLLLVSNVAGEAEIVQLQEDTEPLQSSLENGRHQAEDAGLVCGEQMRLKVHEALTEACKERDAARKKAEEAEVACALLRAQANKMLEAAWKQAADAVNSSKEAEKRAARAEQCQAEAEAVAEIKIMQLWHKVERLLSSLENAKRRAEDAALARGEQMRLQLQKALAEACQERDAAMKKATVAEATCALLRVQENQLLEATQKWTADSERHRVEAEAKLEDAERYRCAYKNLRKWIIHELWLQEKQTNRNIYPQSSEDIRDRGRRGCACPGIDLERVLKALDIIIDTFQSSMHTAPTSMASVTPPAPPAQEATKEA